MFHFHFGQAVHIYVPLVTVSLVVINSSLLPGLWVSHVQVHSLIISFGIIASDSVLLTADFVQLTNYYIIIIIIIIKYNYIRYYIFILCESNQPVDIQQLPVCRPKSSQHPRQTVTVQIQHVTYIHIIS